MYKSTGYKILGNLVIILALMIFVITFYWSFDTGFSLFVTRNIVALPSFLGIFLIIRKKLKNLREDTPINVTVYFKILTGLLIILSTIFFIRILVPDPLVQTFTIGFIVAIVTSLFMVTKWQSWQ